MTTTFDRITHQYGITHDGIEYETTFKAEEYIDPKIEVDGNTVTITYASHDDYHPWNPLEDDEFIQFQEFRSEDARNDWAAEMAGEGWTIFFVNHFEHSSSSYSVISPDVMSLGFRCEHCSKVVDEYGVDTEGDSLCGHHRSIGFYYEACEAGDDGAESYDHDPQATTVNHGYRAGWDDRPSGVIALNPAAGFTDIYQAAVSTMETYTYWVNGEVYSIATETYTLVDGEAVPEDYDIVGGYFGSTETEQLIASGDF